MTTGDSRASSTQPQSSLSKGENGRVAPGTASKHASITELELQFAQNPQSTAYVDLCEAYIASGRLMEAMVVCKKGLKAHPDSIEARVLMARVYAAQKKHPRAFEELEDILKTKGENALVFLARAKVRSDLGEDSETIADLKRAVDLDPTLGEAKELLLARGVVYPPPPPPPPPAQAVVPPPPLPSASGTSPFRGPQTALTPPHFPPASVPTGPVGLSPDPADAFAQVAGSSGFEGVAPPRASSVFHPAHQPVPSGYSVRPQRLEGEDELERLAAKVAEERPPKGRARTTVVLLVSAMFLAIGILGYRISAKRTTEAIDMLSVDAEKSFNRDTYGSYLEAARKYEEILKQYDSDHALTLGRLAYVYAILYGEHGEMREDNRTKLDESVKRALDDAPEVSFTIAAHGLQLLYTAPSRQAGAQEALQAVQPLVNRWAESGIPPNHADLTMGIIEVELGDYEQAARRLSNVKKVLPQSVRAKVWHARAAYRASRLETAEAAFSEALRTEPAHPGARAGRALVRLERGALAGAAEDLLAFDEAEKKNDKDVSPRDEALANYARSEIARSTGEDAKAKVIYEEAVKKDPGNADFPHGLGRWLLRNQRAEEALVPLRKAVEMEKSRWVFLVDLAEAEMLVKDYKSAEERIESAIRKAPDYLPAALAKARLLRRTERPTTEAYIKGLLEKWPSAKVEIHLELGNHYGASGRFDDARKVLEEAISEMASYPKVKQAEVLLTYGKVMERLGERKVASESFKTAAEYGDLEGWYRLAMVLARGSNEDRAEAKKAIERYLAAGKSLKYSSSAEDLRDRLQ